MSDIIDLDILQPEPKKIKLNGKILDLYPGKLKTIIRIQKAFVVFKDTQGTDSEALDKVIDALAEIIPDLKNDDVDIAVTQIPKLIELAYRSALPEDSKVVAKSEMAVQKKTESSKP